MPNIIPLVRNRCGIEPMLQHSFLERKESLVKGAQETGAAASPNPNLRVAAYRFDVWR